MTRWVFGIFIIIAVVITAFFMQLIALPADSGSEDTAGAEYAYHVQIAIRDTESYFSQQFQLGAKSAGEALDTYVEFVPVMLRDLNALQEIVEMGVNADVDGMALQAMDVTRSAEIIDNARNQGLSIITYESGNYLLPDVPTVGSNYFSTGVMAGTMAAEAAGRDAHAVVVLNKEGQDDDAQQQSIILQGIEDVSSDVGLKIEDEDIYTIDPGLFEAESLGSELFFAQSPPDVVICLDERSTPALAQMLVNAGGVGNTQIIGYGAMPQTLDYIERGVIYGSVCPDAYKTGFITVEQLQNMLRGIQVSNYNNPKLHRIDKTNASEYVVQEGGDAL